jgi:glycosyltransferase involved in cell wall biosynthesis
MIRLLFVLPNLNGGGAERVTVTLLRHLDPSRYQLELFLIRRSGVYLNELPEHLKLSWGCESHQRPLFYLPRVIWRLFQSARRSDILIGALEFTVTYIAFIMGKLLHKPVVGWVHSNLLGHLPQVAPIHRLIVKLIYPRLNRTVLLTEVARSAIEQITSISRHTTKVLPNPLDMVSIVRLADEPLPLWTEAILNKPMVITVGSLRKPKCFDLLIRACARLKQIGQEVNLLILGEGPEHSALEAEAKMQGITESVFMPGFVVNPYPLIKAATVLALSSRYEGLPTVLLEALALGTPVVATDCMSGPREILQEGKYGLLTLVDDIDMMTQNIAKLLSDSALRQDFSERGLERAKDYSPERIIPQWESLFNEIL